MSLVNSEFFGPVTRLITLIAEAVWAVAQQFPSLDERFFILCDWSISEVNERDLRARLTGRGWCLSLYSKIKNMARTPSSFFEYVSFVPPLEDLVGKHRNCSVDECVGYNVDVPNYHTTHRIVGCKCEMICPPVRDVKKALLEWTVPIMDGIGLLDLNSEGTVQVYSPDRPLKFVAFSHVWSDGLGSVTEDGLRKCQVEYLLEAALQAAGTTMFWIDSLCVPKEHDIRKRAISMMAKTYESANTTVVLDSRIRRCSLSVSLEAKIVSLSLSKWQERLWTLQESSLSKRVVFAFEDGFAPAEAIASESSPKVHRPVVMTGQILLDNLSDWVHNNEVTVGGLQRNLYRRTSSRPDDESLAIAPFLKIDIAPLLEVQGEERMMRFWSMARHVPKGIVLHSLPMIDHDGYGWAPRSIMNQKNAPMLDLKDQSATVTEDGLKGEYWVYELQTPSHIPLQGETLFYDPRSNCCLRLIEHASAPNISLSSNCVVIFIKQPVPSTETYVGVALPRVSDLRRTRHQQVPMYKYRGIVGPISFQRLKSMLSRDLICSGILQ